MIISERVSVSSAEKSVDFYWPIGDNVVYGISMTKINSLDNLQREQLVREISEGIKYFLDFKNECDYIINGDQDINVMLKQLDEIIKNNINEK